MLTDLFFGLLGFVAVGLAYAILGRRQATNYQKIILLLLGLVSLSIYLIWGLFNFGLEVGPELNLLVFQISYGTSEGLMWLLGLIIPLVLTVILIVFMKKFGRIKRFLLPVLLLVAIVGLNFFQIYRYYQKHIWDFNQPNFIINCLPSDRFTDCTEPD